MVMTIICTPLAVAYMGITLDGDNDFLESFVDSLLDF